MHKVRAKFRCNSVELHRATANTSEYDALLTELGKTYGDAEADRIAKERDIERYRTFDQPTIKMSAVVGMGDDGENKSWSSATPNGNLQMTISNPDAAEQFELGKHYYIDFTAAD